MIMMSFTGGLSDREADLSAADNRPEETGGNKAQSSETEPMLN